MFTFEAGGGTALPASCPQSLAVGDCLYLLSCRCSWPFTGYEEIPNTTEGTITYFYLDRWNSLGASAHGTAGKYVSSVPTWWTYNKVCCKVCILLRKRKREETREASCFLLERGNICHLAWFGWCGCNLLKCSAEGFRQGLSPAFSLFLLDTGTAWAHEPMWWEQVLLYSATLQCWETIELGQRQESSDYYYSSKANDFSVAAACSELQSMYQEKDETIHRAGIKAPLM